MTVDSVILNLFNGAATDLAFTNIKIHPYNLGYDDTSVVCDPDVFTSEDLANLGFKCQDGQFAATS
jgi:hypothetical protein